MDDKNPTPENPTPEQPGTPEQPAAAQSPAPAQPDATPAADTPTVPVEPTAPAAAQPAPASTAPAGEATPPAKPGRKRALLIGGGIAAAVLLAGGGVAVGAAIGDEFGDDDHPSMEGPRHGDHRDGDHGPRDDDGPREGDRDDRPAGAGGPVTGIGTASIDELLDIAEAARGAADGEVTSIDAKRDGTWEVQLTTATGDESDVRVDDDLKASVVATEKADDDDTGPTLTLDDETIRALVEAALAEADGMITDLDVDADDVSPYDASVLTADNRSVDIEFDASFAVVGTDLDD
ncbi:hypothetical protein ACFV3I_01125 [Microbacterium sp. NPDC059771]|uniref:hypothetical protein n=1 Tax=Microbacterium sp. NPDC059771 TaxID=3346941 RepID=UPI00365B9267